MKTPNYAIGHPLQFYVNIELYWQNDPLGANARNRLQNYSWENGDTVCIKRGGFVFYENGASGPWEEPSELMGNLATGGCGKRIRTKVIFTVERGYKNRRCRIIAPGYGAAGNYGKGHLLVWGCDLTRKLANKKEE